MPGLHQVACDVGADVAAAGDHDPHQWPLVVGLGEVFVERLDVVAGDGGVDEVAVLGHGVGLRNDGDAESGESHDPGHAGDVEVGQQPPGPAARDHPLDEAHPGRRVDPLDGRAVGKDAQQDSLGRPHHGRDRGNAEALVDRGTSRILDAGDDPLDVERLPGHAGDEDVRVVAAGHRGEGSRLLDAGLAEPVPVESHADHRASLEVLRQADECT